MLITGDRTTSPDRKPKAEVKDESSPVSDVHKPKVLTQSVCLSVCLPLSLSLSLSLSLLPNEVRWDQHMASSHQGPGCMFNDLFSVSLPAVLPAYADFSFSATFAR